MEVGESKKGRNDDVFFYIMQLVYFQSKYLSRLHTVPNKGNNPRMNNWADFFAGRCPIRAIFDWWYWTYESGIEMVWECPYKRNQRNSPRQSICVFWWSVGNVSIVIYLLETFIITGTYIAFSIFEVFELLHLFAFERVNGSNGARQRYTIL